MGFASTELSLASFLLRPRASAFCFKIPMPALQMMAVTQIHTASTVGPRPECLPGKKPKASAKHSSLLPSTGPREGNPFREA